MSTPDSTLGIRDGFVVRTWAGEEVTFVACDKNGRLRERVLSGLLRNMRPDVYVADTRDDA